MAGQEVEQTMKQLAQIECAAELLLIMANQHASLDSIADVIKANLTAHVGFPTISKIDSRTFLREQGEPAYLDDVTEPVEGNGGDGDLGESGISGAGDSNKSLSDQAVDMVARKGEPPRRSSSGT